jgi:hypothetical protein
MEQNQTLENIKAFVESYAQNTQSVEEPAWQIVFMVLVALFSGIGIIASVKFVYRFVKNGFRLKEKPVTTRYVFVDSYAGMAFVAAIISFAVLFVVRAIAASKSGF